MPAEPEEPFTATLVGGAPRTFGEGRYAVQSVLGEGGQKIAYFVRDAALDCDCTLALIKADCSSRPI